MEELVLLKGNEIVCNSLQVAKKFHKRHDNVLRSIEGLLKNKETKSMFVSSNYTEVQNGQIYRMYYMNRDGFSLLAMGFTGKKALEWKLKYIQAFNQMEQQLKEKQSIRWQATRLESKNIRKLETDEIKELVEYAKAQGSENAEKYYMALSKLANKTVGISSKERETATINQLNTLILVENIINHMIQEGIRQELPYKKIYQTCKQRLEQFQEIAFLTSKEDGGAL